jgi:hypothetical protein
MESIFDAITEWIKELLIGSIEGNLSSMFGDVNEKVGTIATQVGQTPQGWNYAPKRVEMTLPLKTQAVQPFAAQMDGHPRHRRPARKGADKPRQGQVSTITTQNSIRS